MSPAARHAGPAPNRPGMRMAIALGSSLVFHAVLVQHFAPSATASLARAAAGLRIHLLAPQPADAPFDLAAPARASDAALERLQGGVDSSRAAPATGNEGASDHRALVAPPLVAPLETPRYLTASELDRRAAPLGTIEPWYPAGALNTNGKIVLLLLISESGAVDRVLVEFSEPKGKFEESAIRAFSKARFSPGMRAGRPAKSQMMIELEYVPESKDR